MAQQENAPQEMNWQWTEVTDSSALDQPIFDALPVDEANELEAIDVAEMAQAEALEAVEFGDYAAAAELRETAEEAAAVAGDSSMLEGATSIELEAAAEHQQAVEAEQVQQAEAIERGDYEAARDHAFDATWEEQTADDLAQSTDTASAAANDFDQLNDAVWNEQTADEFASDAIDYAEQGSDAAAEAAATEAFDYQAAADELASDSNPADAWHDDPLYPETETYQPDPMIDDYDGTYE